MPPSPKTSRPSAWLIVGAALSFAACGGNHSRQKIGVYAAASLSEAFRALAPGFEAAHPGAQMQFNFAGSQTLASQLVEGGPADVYASANPNQMERVRENGRIGESFPFAGNRVVLATPADNPASLSTVDDLGRDGIRIVLAGPSVPAGDYARRALRASGHWETVEPNVVSNEDSVRGVVSKLVLGEADAGLIYASDAELADLRTIELPEAARIDATYEAAVVLDADDPQRARAFVEFLQGDAARTTLSDHGFSAYE